MYRERRFKRIHAKTCRLDRLGAGSVHRYEILYRTPKYVRHRKSVSGLKRWRKSKQWGAIIRKDWALMKKVPHHYWPWMWKKQMGDVV